MPAQHRHTTIEDAMVQRHSAWPGPRMARADLPTAQHQTTDIADDDLELTRRTRAPVLITAERRDEREACARLIHVSRNERGPFVVLLVDAESARATDSHAREAADVGVGVWRKFDQARDGTLFIDDITNLTEIGQSQVYCLLGELQRVTDRSGARLVRIIAGAGRHLEAECRSGVFWDALFYRLNVVHLDRI